MKKRTETYKIIHGICGRNYKLTLVVLILLFSIIVVSGSEEKKLIDDQESSGVTQNPTVISMHEAENSEHTVKNPTKNTAPDTSEGIQSNSHPKEEVKNRIESSESLEENSKSEIGATEQTHSYENTGNEQQQTHGLMNRLQINTPSQKNNNQNNQNFESNPTDNKVVKVLKDAELTEDKTKQSVPESSTIEPQKSTESFSEVKGSSEKQIEEQNEADKQEKEQEDKIGFRKQKTLTSNDRLGQKTEFTTEQEKPNIVNEHEKVLEKPEQKTWFDKKIGSQESKEKNLDKLEQNKEVNKKYEKTHKSTEEVIADHSDETIENEGKEKSNGNLVSDLNENKLKQPDEQIDELRQEKAPEDKTGSKEELEKAEEEIKNAETEKKSDDQGNIKDNLEKSTLKNVDSSQKDTNDKFRKKAEEVENIEKTEKTERTESKDKEETIGNTNIWTNNEESAKKEPEQEQYFDEVTNGQNPVRSENSQENVEKIQKNIEKNTAETGTEYFTETLKNNPAQEPVTDTYAEYPGNTEENLGNGLEKEPETGDAIGYENNAGSIINIQGLNIVSKESMATADNIDNKDDKETNVKLETITKNDVLNLKTSPEANEKEAKGLVTKDLNSELESEPEVQKCNGTIGQTCQRACPVAEARTREVKTCNVTRLENNEIKSGAKPESKTEVFNWTCNPETPKLDAYNKSEIKPDENSWQNLRFILSYSYALDSFYTIHNPVKIDYKGPDALGQQQVDVYLIKKASPGFSEGTLMDETDVGKINFEELLNKNTESYIRVPEVLNDNGDLSPLVFGPLPAGDYWTVITIAGDEAGSPGEKEVLSAKYFKVLESELTAEVQGTVKEGEDFEVELALDNTPEAALENCTYWAVLINEKAYRANNDGSSRNIKTGIEGFLKKHIITENFELSSTANSPMYSGNYRLALTKAEFKNEVQDLIGEGNGAISIGEENENTLALTSLNLSPGNYLLFAGAFEEDKGLVGIAQKRLTIYTPKTV